MSTTASSPRRALRRRRRPVVAQAAARARAEEWSFERFAHTLLGDRAPLARGARRRRTHQGRALRRPDEIARGVRLQLPTLGRRRTADPAPRPARLPRRQGERRLPRTRPALVETRLSIAFGIGACLAGARASRSGPSPTGRAGGERAVAARRLDREVDDPRCEPLSALLNARRSSATSRGRSPGRRTRRSTSAPGATIAPRCSSPAPQPFHRLEECSRPPTCPTAVGSKGFGYTFAAPISTR